MPMTLDQIVEEVRHWPPEQLTELVDRLAETIHASPSPIEEAWKRETRRRIAELESGDVQGIPGDEVSDRVRRIVGR